MFDIFYKYLILKKRVTLPGVGVFLMNRKPAEFNQTDSSYLPPFFEIEYKKQKTEPDTNFFVFISEESGIDRAEAVRQFNEFSRTVEQGIKAHESFDLPGIGRIRKDVSGDVRFEPDHHVPAYLSPVTADVTPTEEAVLTEDGSSQKLAVDEVLIDDEDTGHSQKEYWWIIALVLGALAIVAIVYYYYQNGSLR
jgi:nucleoid DNA-binding protein